MGGDDPGRMGIQTAHQEPNGAAELEVVPI
jgi:hypothetical protein